MEKVTFKSFPEYYEKEKSGIKNNIIVFVSEENSDICKTLCSYFGELINELEVEIVNPKTKESFIRKVRDVSYYNRTYVITWDDKEVQKMRDRKSKIIREDIPLICWNNVITSQFSKIVPNLDYALNKCEEEFDELLEELNLNNGHFESVHDISKDAIKEMLDTLQAYATLISFIAAERGDFNEILSMWKRKQKQRLREYIGEDAAKNY